MKLIKYGAKDAAFSIKELMIVITVVAVIGSVAAVFLLKSKGAAKSSGCENNLRQIYTASAMYTESNGKKLPYASFTKDDAHQTAWDSLVQTYMRAAMKTDPNRPPPSATTISKLFLCPADTLPGVVWGKKSQPRRTYSMTPHTMQAPNWPPSPTNSTGLGLVWSFRKTGNASVEAYTTNKVPAFLVDTLLDPKNIIMFTEQVKSNNVVFNSSGSTVNYTGNHLDSSIPSETFQEGRMYYLMLDGHVEYLFPDQTVGATGEIGQDSKKHQGLWTVRPGD
ncbi:MAG: N-terminal cleavage protein [Verrucomicrobia bacterium]|nr:N-terminal cleavage protein [Verrucomicrobiota bacterium]